MPFAVIDFETTGIFPEHNHRIIEVGLALVSDEGTIETEWTTLVNPHRDVGAGSVHGLCARDLWGAPDFCAIADQIVEFLSGRTVVAHNANFDMRFLQAELGRAGYIIPDCPAALCSMKWSGRLIGPAGLQQVCEALDIDFIDAHSAMADARATAGVLACLMRFIRSEPEWTGEWTKEADYSRQYAWPALRGCVRARTVPRGEHKPDPQSWLNQVLSAVHIPGVPEDEASYLLVLNRALLDRIISLSEGQELVAAAKAAGLNGANIARVHRSYLQAVAQEALLDGKISEAEKADLIIVADLLGLASSDVDVALKQAVDRQGKRKGDRLFSLHEGDRIVFTGELSRPREEWVAEILAAGLTTGGISKATRLVVAADPDSMSSKAEKARAYNVPIIDEGAFSRLFQEYRAGIS